ncbi:MAG: putative monovalent cation/H+ antiporter subunit A [Chitinophagaceae bacterium]|nr:putative monovalent cation/H+ antiporter subunit A [Chitinophagaceae bacterium]MCW5928016.1 putative monovalent cation/H+ antiporter subunit A [Chitinophagaceae bacterium]
MLTAVLAGFFVSILLIPFGKYLKNRLSVLLVLLPALLFGYFAGFIPAVSAGNPVYSHHAWVPSAGINLDFHLDGLSLLFCLLITGIGTLVYIYAVAYMKGHPYLDRFFAYLSIFMAAMLGVVLSDNVLLLFIFWELTSISSFFLIGFNNDNADSRKSSITALAITAGGGFLLMAGLILAGYLSDTHSIREMILSNAILKSHSLYGLVLLLVFAGAFTKSAQFPFHFWLPGAMKAPTPVSAYLHSATMVKAGIYLLARLFPVLGGTDYWTVPLVIIGGCTMLLGAIISIFKKDLKEILAYSTISALGVLVFLIGVGTEAALTAAAVFILVHALYKATLFLVTGIIDHETQTRDISQLSGLRKLMLPVAIAGALAALSSAGIPLTLGFIGKDLIYEATLHTKLNFLFILTAIAVITNIFLVSAGFLAGIKPFTGSLPERLSGVHLPHWFMWMPPLILAFLGILFGSFPGWVGTSVLQPAAAAITNNTAGSPLKIWHGFNLVLLLSAVTIVSGTLLYLFKKTTAASSYPLLSAISAEKTFKRMGDYVKGFSTWYSNTMHNGFLRSYLLRIIIFAVLLLAYRVINGEPLEISLARISTISIYEIVVAGILIAAVYMTVTSTSRLTAVVGTSVIGYCICLMFVFYSAPDLAMTQFTIDTLTLVLFVFVLFRLPPFLNFANSKVRLRDGIVSTSFGVLIGIIALQALNEPIQTDISKFYGENAYTMAKGRNVVNVILVDFRGMDTMFEIVVLSIAALGVFSLINLRLKSSEKE